MMTVIAATGNEHKLRELKEILGKYGMNVISQEEAGFGDVDIVEDGESFDENSFIKAEAIMELSGQIAVADDSGLEVDYLNGAPGVHSARYAGEHKSDEDNNNKLLKELEGVPAEQRTAQFVSVVTLMYPDGRMVSARGFCPGQILFEPRGTGGFGYDPLFLPDGQDQTFAEMDQETKNKISHRANALKNLESMLK
ncbi:MAG: XTP/dITP diphosphatase [Firmicutes bacterium]|jgi:XTP/dITP diphosphohydrolase|nr:XTP/dITP diphosphatase [Bacillota bacterium]MBR6503541.1 XTP/dITP diphosphatase [Bacillota bacterium]